MDVQYVFEEIKQKYKRSNKYMLCVTYEDIGILIDIIEVLDRQLKGNNIKLTKEQKENTIRYLRIYKDSLNEKAVKEKNIYLFEQLLETISNIIYIINILED